jgi:hypothetical protein
MKTARAAAYQVAARMMAAEQQVAWSRVQGFLAFNAILAAAIGGNIFGTQPAVQIAMALVGFLLSWPVLFSLRRSWAYRNVFAAVMREHERVQGVTDIGPVTIGNAAREKAGVLIGGQRHKVTGFKQHHLSYAVCVIFMAIYVALMVWKTMDAFKVYVFCKA